MIADGKKEDIFYQRNELQEAYVKPPLSTQIAQEIGIKKKDPAPNRIFFLFQILFKYDRIPLEKNHKKFVL